jgi:DNA polymerase III sliding clamp (beta) subunit (PCNA family)
MIEINARSFQDAAKLLKRLSFAKTSLPVLSHVKLQGEGQHATLTVTNLNLHLEVRVPLLTPLEKEVAFLIPWDAFRQMLKADKDSPLTLSPGGTAKEPTLNLHTSCGGMTVEATYAGLPVGDFPSRPGISGPSTLLPARTFQQLALVAPCAYREAERAGLQGVHFSPEEGGHLIATDGKRLAATPATVPVSTAFTLPNPAVKVLSDFGAATVTISGRDGNQRVAFHSQDVLLISNTVSGRFPEWKQVVPREENASATLTDKDRAAFVRWLRSLPKQDGSVTLVAGKTTGNKEILKAHHAQRGTVLSTVEVPVKTRGKVPPLQLEPRYLATALTLGPTLCFLDSLSPLVVRGDEARGDEAGALGVVMPMRLTVLPEEQPALQTAA